MQSLSWAAVNLDLFEVACSSSESGHDRVFHTGGCTMFTLCSVLIAASTAGTANQSGVFPGGVPWHHPEKGTSSPHGVNKSEVWPAWLPRYQDKSCVVCTSELEPLSTPVAVGYA